HVIGRVAFVGVVKGDVDVAVGGVEFFAGRRRRFGELRFVQGAGAVDGDPVGLDQAYGEGAEFGDEAIGDGLVLVCAFAHSVELDYVAVGLVDGQAVGGAGFAARGDGGVDPRQGFFARRVDHVD